MTLYLHLAKATKSNLKKIKIGIGSVCILLLGSIGLVSNPAAASTTQGRMQVSARVETVCSIPVDEITRIAGSILGQSKLQAFSCGVQALGHVAQLQSDRIPISQASPAPTISISPMIQTVGTVIRIDF